ncbi:helix-turn-helix transcriptional regulator [Lusitaniella coriacea LEGE 07157]|uniref:Helix-turn-helix transcriptional regulator n=1 Tax=Lusitaniella coriacea LEGE 07157 TaxID=945747 RepID=A0A8J7DZW9_9CYAN|nr:helix-turn-helix transcriptional regulator [Lusitaniella coriacea]MBE9117633.1 helix-turn-helix transcriptional regulator [Lusitaniella coriacea LEGE 07157]
MSVDPPEQEQTLKSFRNQLNLSQEELARRLNLSFRTIGEWEGGKKIPRFDNAVALARELGISLKTLARAMHLNIEGVPDDLL